MGFQVLQRQVSTQPGQLVHDLPSEGSSVELADPPRSQAPERPGEIRITKPLAWGRGHAVQEKRLGGPLVLA